MESQVEAILEELRSIKERLDRIEGIID